MKKYIYISVVALLFSCTSNTIYKKPDDLIPKDQMIDLLTDMYIATAAKSIRNINSERRVNYMPLVFEKYQIDSARFAQSNFYYTSKIDEYEAIYKEVEKRLKKMNRHYDSIQIIADSINKQNRLKNTPRSIKKKEIFKDIELDMDIE